MDIRVKRTYKMLFDALTKLLTESEYDKITVAEICAESTVHRTTFYKHFDDKYDFYRAYLEYLTQDFLDRAPVKRELDSPLAYIRYMQEALMDFIEETPGVKKTFVRKTLGAPGYDMLVEHMIKGICERLDPIDGNRTTSSVSAIDINVATTYYVGGLLHLVKWWLVNDKPCTKQELIERTMKLASFPSSFKGDSNSQQG